MKSVKLLVISALCVSVSQSALRIRYTNPENHNLEHNSVKTSQDYWNEMHPGAWDGWDPATGFKNVAADNFGSLANAPKVDATFWVDSLYEDYQDGPFVGNIGESELINPEHSLATDGYFVLGYGGLHITSSGNYTFYSVGDDGGMQVWIDVNKDGEFSQAEAIHSNPKEEFGMDLDPPGTTRTGIWSAGFTKSLNLDQGVYKIRFWKWDHSQVSYAALFWKKPGSDNITLVPSSAFGERRQFGPPVAHITKVTIGSDSYVEGQMGYIDVAKCQEVTLHSSAENMLGQQPTFVWNFDDGTPEVTTTETSVTHKFAQSVLRFPKVKVRRGTQISASANENVMLMVADGCSDNSTNALTPGSVAAAGWALQGNHLTLSNPAGGNVRLMLHAPDGKLMRTLQATGSEATFQLDPSLAGGSYVARILGAEGPKVLRIDLNR